MHASGFVLFTEVVVQLFLFEFIFRMWACPPQQMGRLLNTL